MMTKFEIFERSDMIFFIIVTAIVSGFVLPLELLNIFGLRHIIILKKINWTRLLFLLPAAVEIYRVSINSESRPDWLGLDLHHLSALSWGLLIFLYRDNYIVITDKIIKFQGMGGWIDSIKIKWSEMTRIEITDSFVNISSNDKKIEVKYNEINKRQLQFLINLIENKNKMHRAQHTI